MQAIRHALAQEMKDFRHTPQLFFKQTDLGECSVRFPCFYVRVWVRVWVGYGHWFVCLSMYACMCVCVVLCMSRSVGWLSGRAGGRVRSFIYTHRCIGIHFSPCLSSAFNELY